MFVEPLPDIVIVRSVVVFWELERALWEPVFVRNFSELAADVEAAWDMVEIWISPVLLE